MNRFTTIRDFGLFVLMSLPAVLWSCGNAGNNKPADTLQETVSNAAPELPLPDIPDGIEDPVERADYITAHFWDGMDFSDTGLSLDTAFMEQNFVNFVELYYYGSDSGAKTATTILMDKAGRAGREPYKFLTGIVDRYLYDPNSPMLDEGHYIIFLEEYMSSTILSDDEKERYRYILSSARKNRPGTIATDFSFTDRKGRTSTLHAAAASTPYSLLLFYDPDCENCESAVERLSKDPAVNGMISGGTLAVIAIDAEGDKARWEATRNGMPASWTVGYDTSSILDNDTYVYAATPTIYLLDNDSRVLAKDARPEQIIAWASNQ